MNSMMVCFLALGLFAGLALIALGEAKQIPGYSASDRAQMEDLIDQVTAPEVRKLPPVSKMPPKKGLRWISLAKTASQTEGEGFNDYLDLAGRGIVK